MLNLYDDFKKLDSKFDPKAMLSSNLATIPSLVNYMAKHAIVTPYSFNLKKCNYEACHGAIHTPANIWHVVMQRQYVPRLDPLQKGHSFRREDVLVNTSVGDATLICFTDVTSMSTENMKVGTKKFLTD